MGRSTGVAGSRKKKLGSLIDFCAELSRKLPDCVDNALINTILADTTGHIGLFERIQTPPLRAAVQKHGRELEKTAIDLWNTCVRQSRKQLSEPLAAESRKRLLLAGKILACLVLDLGKKRSDHDGEAKEIRDLTELMGLILKAVNKCFELNELGWALIVLQKAAECDDRLQFLRETVSKDESESIRLLQTEYYILRTAYALKEKNWELADHMFKNSESLGGNIPRDHAEAFADVLYSIGKNLVASEDFAVARKWLERAVDMLKNQDVTSLSKNGSELRLCIYYELVQALVGDKTRDSLDQAENVVSYLVGEMGDTPGVRYLQLSMLKGHPPEEFNIDAYSQVLRRMILGASDGMSESLFKLLVKEIRELGSKEPDKARACKLLEDLLFNCALKTENQAWIEKLVILRVWMATTHGDDAKGTESLGKTLAKLAENINRPLGVEMTTAVIALVWPKIEATYASANFAFTDSWCCLALHDLFANMGPSNQAKVHRKRILCALSLHHHDEALAIFGTLPQSIQNESMTRYLMFRAALVNDDISMASDCLNQILNNDKNQDFLLACIQAAQQGQHKFCAADAMGKLVKLYNSEPAGSKAKVHVPALLRCTIRLQNRIFDAVTEEEGCGPDAVADQLCEIYESAVGEMIKDYTVHGDESSSERTFSLRELMWFTQNAYNTAVKRCAEWQPRHVGRMFEAGLAVMHCFPSDIPTATLVKTKKISMRSHFGAAAAAVSLARAEDSVDSQSQHYLATRRHVAGYDAVLEETKEPGLLADCGRAPRSGDHGNSHDDRIQDECGGGEIRADLLAKLGVLLVWDFEAAVALQDYDGLGQVVRRAKFCCDPTPFMVMGDLILRSQVPTRVLYATMKLIVDGIWKTDERFNTNSLAKYLRCMLQAVLPTDTDVGLEVVTQVCEIAMKVSNTEHAFPSEELEWIATTAFNRAVDFYSAEEDDPCRRWAEKAMELAGFCNDGGMMEREMSGRYVMLKLG